MQGRGSNKRQYIWATALVLACVAAPVAAWQASVPVLASDDLRTRMAEERAALATARRQANEAEQRSASLGQQAAAAQNAAERDRIELASFGLRVQAAEARVAAARAALAIARQQEASQQRVLNARQKPVMDLLARLQLLSRRPPLTMLAQPGTASDIVHARAVVESMMPRVREQTAALRSELAETRRLRQLRATAFADVEQSIARLASDRTELARRAAASRQQAVAIAGDAGFEADRAQALALEASDIGTLVGELEGAATVRDRLARLEGPAPRPGTITDGRGEGQVPTTGDGTATVAYRLPVIGRIERGLGDVSTAGERSRGLTIRVEPGAQIIAPAGGRVVYAGVFRSFGQIIIIDHGHGWTSLITDMAAVSARVGDEVLQGAPVGRAGPGRPSVTVELRRNGQPMDIATLVSA
jgi:septal ring factor EnvC (AmiA/AmiB activator)